MHFLTILALTASATAGVAGRNNRSLWSQRGPVRGGRDLESTNGFVEKTQNLARDAADAVNAQSPFKADEEEDKPVSRKFTDGLFSAWTSVTNRVSGDTLGKRDTADDSDDNLTVSLDDDDDEEDVDEDDYADDDWSDSDDEDFDDDDEDLSDPTKLARRDVEDSDDNLTVSLDDEGADAEAVEEAGEDYADEDEEDVDEDDYADDDWSDEDNEDLGDEVNSSNDSTKLAARDVDDAETGDDDAEADTTDDAADEPLDLNVSEDDLVAYERLGDEEDPSEEPEEDSLDDEEDSDSDETATSELEARDAAPEPEADPEARRLFSFGRKPQGIVEKLVWRRDAEEEKGSGTDAPAPLPQPGHQALGHGHSHLHRRHAEPEMQAGPVKERSRTTNLGRSSFEAAASLLRPMMETSPLIRVSSLQNTSRRRRGAGDKSTTQTAGSIADHPDAVLGSLKAPKVFSSTSRTSRRRQARDKGATQTAVAEPEPIKTARAPALAQQVFGTTELLEEVLLKLPMKDLFMSQKVCKRWKAVLEQSIRIQRTIFFVPATTKDDSEVIGFEFPDHTLDPEPQRLAGGKDENIANPLLLHDPTVAPFVSIRLDPKLPNYGIEASCFRMYITQPLTSFKNGRVLPGYPKSRERGEGERLGQLAQGVIEDAGGRLSGQQSRWRISLRR